MFQFTRPRGARPPARRPPSPHQSFQFTRPRGARHAVANAPFAEPPFQFTRPRGARPKKSSTKKRAQRFNSRAHAGRDPSRTNYSLCMRVSIHAPTRGATHPQKRKEAGTMFQFTRPRGARQSKSNVQSGTQGFNSRAHAGRDRLVRGASAKRSVSIHAPTRGAT